MVRMFAPFVAGVGAMTYPRFLVHNVSGGVGELRQAGQIEGVMASGSESFDPATASDES